MGGGKERGYNKDMKNIWVGWYESKGNIAY